MKILSIQFKNINSLRGEHQIDFTAKEFVQNPLFAITGPTGSGKTTLLDVISLALFNEVPRLGKISSTVVQEQGAVLTRGQDKAFAQVNYQCNSGKYASVWSIHRASSGKVQPHSMEITQLDTNERLDLKNSEVPGKNEELIGLNYDQFIKSVLLAQGEFSKFLKAARRDRSELLENITGTKIYRELGKLAFQKYNEVKKEIEEQNILLENEKSRIFEEEQRLALEEELKKLTKTKSDQEKEQLILKKQIEIKKELQKLEKVIAERNKNLEEINLQKEVFEKEHSDRLEKHNRVARHATDLHSWSNKKQTLGSLSEDKEKLTQRKSDFSKDRESLFDRIKTFVGEEFEVEKAEEKLQEFRKKISGLIQERQQLIDRYKSNINILESELRIFNLDSIKDLGGNPQDWQELMDSVKAERKKFEEIFSTYPDNPEEVLQQKEKELERIQKAKEIAQQLTYFEEQSSEIQKKLLRTKEELEPLPKTIEENKKQLVIAEKDQKIFQLQRDNQLLEASLESHRHKLEDGKPCPLCGALEHPYAVDSPEKESESERLLNEKEREVRKLNDLISQQSNKLELLQQQKVEYENELHTNKEKRKTLEEDFSEIYEERKAVGFIEQQIQKTREYINKIKQYQDFKLRDKALERAKPIYEDLREILRLGKEKKEEISKLYQGTAIDAEVSELQKSWQKINHTISSAEEQLREILNKVKTETSIISQLENPLLDQLMPFGFNDLKAAFSALMPNDEYEQIRNKIQEFKDKINRFSAEIKTYSSQKLSLTEQIKSQKSLSELEKEDLELTQKIREIITEINHAERKLKNDEDSLKQIQEIKKNIKKMEKDNFRWMILDKMIGDAKGNTFNQFAQDLTLKHLLRLANERLKGINDRYMLKMVPGMPSNKDNLVIADKDMGGQERAVHTLSGGETFLMSLGLALALSDLASQKIKINSLFIDEGFGTLDPETLDQTLDTLERLQASSTKTIGIISHVDSLKERIATQIKLEKSGQGYSSMKIVSA